VTRLALAIDYSSTALHCTYGPGPVPLRAVLRLRGQQPEERIASACDQLVTLLDRLERRWAPSMGLLVMERPFVGKNARSGIALAQVQAACLTTAYLWRWTVLQEDPSRIRANVIGLGVAPKGEKIKDYAMAWARSEYDLELDGDAADSLVVWRYALELLDHHLVEEESCSTSPAFPPPSPAGPTAT
jgi:Holliday junction resolvasome RuvABC endonuclease subunit